MKVELLPPKPITRVDFVAGDLVYCKHSDVLVLVVDGDFENKSSKGCFAGIALKSDHHELFEVDTFWDSFSFKLYEGEVKLIAN